LTRTCHSTPMPTRHIRQLRLHHRSLTCDAAHALVRTMIAVDWTIVTVSWPTLRWACSTDCRPLCSLLLVRFILRLPLCQLGCYSVSDLMCYQLHFQSLHRGTQLYPLPRTRLPHPDVFHRCISTGACCTSSCCIMSSIDTGYTDVD